MGSRDKDTTSSILQRDQLKKIQEMASYFEGNHSGTYVLYVTDRGQSIDNRTQVTAQWESIIYERITGYMLFQMRPCSLFWRDSRRENGRSSK